MGKMKAWQQEVDSTKETLHKLRRQRKALQELMEEKNVEICLYEKEFEKYMKLMEKNN